MCVCACMQACLNCHACACNPNTINRLSYLVSGLQALTSAAHTTLLGNTHLQYSAVSSSGIGWRSSVGGDLVTIYNLGSQVLSPPV